MRLDLFNDGTALICLLMQNDRLKSDLFKESRYSFASTFVVTVDDENLALKKSSPATRGLGFFVGNFIFKSTGGLLQDRNRRLFAFGKKSLSISSFFGQSLC